MGNIDLMEDACADLPHTTRAMFGGHGLFAPHGGIFAAVVDEDRLILKFADEGERAAFAAIGGHPWTYAGKMTMKEWLLVPDDLYDEPTTLAEWTRRAYLVAPPKKTKGTKAAAGKSPSKAKAGAKRPAGKNSARKPKK